jgi:DNA invertase Pin-like site-specific DNA recombinase
MARKKENKSAKIRKLLAKGMLQSEIVRKVGASPQLVYLVARNLGLQAEGKRGRKVKQVDDRAILDKVWSILNEYRKAA